jgi:hypothetical protein
MSEGERRVKICSCWLRCVRDDRVGVVWCWWEGVDDEGSRGCLFVDGQGGRGGAIRAVSDVVQSQAASGTAQETFEEDGRSEEVVGCGVWSVSMCCLGLKDECWEGVGRSSDAKKVSVPPSNAGRGSVTIAAEA